MKRPLAAVAALALRASVGSAQSKLDQAVAKALEQVQKGKPEDAVKTMTKAAAEAGAEGQVALARLHERLGDLDEAPAAHRQGRAKGGGRGGGAAADRGVAAAASNAMPHVAGGEARTALGRHAEAEQALKRAVELDPKSALAYSRLGRAQVSQSGRITDALASAPPPPPPR